MKRRTIAFIGTLQSTPTFLVPSVQSRFMPRHERPTPGPWLTLAILSAIFLLLADVIE